MLPPKLAAATLAWTALVCMHLPAIAATTSNAVPALDSRYPEFAMPDNSGFTDVKRDCGAKGDGAYWAFDHACRRTWVLNSCYIGAYINTESYVHTHNTNRGGDLWILGIKTEKDRTILDTTDGGRTELFGGFLYKNRQRVGPAPAFTSTDSDVSYNYNAIGVPYAVQVQETRGGETRELPLGATGGKCVLFVGSK